MKISQLRPTRLLHPIFLSNFQHFRNNDVEYYQNDPRFILVMLFNAIRQLDTVEYFYEIRIWRHWLLQSSVQVCGLTDQHLSSPFWTFQSLKVFQKDSLNLEMFNFLLCFFLFIGQLDFGESKPTSTGISNFVEVSMLV